MDGNFDRTSTLNETQYFITSAIDPLPSEPALLLWDDIIALFIDLVIHAAFCRQRYATFRRNAVILSNFKSQIQQTPLTHRRCCSLRGIIRAGPQCLTNFSRKCVMPGLFQ